MKGVELRPGDECRLIRNPELSDRSISVGKDNSLKLIRLDFAISLQLSY
jgi:hypothetical protein